MARLRSAGCPTALAAWPLVGLAAAVMLRAAVFAVALALGQWSTRRLFPAWISFLQIVVFAAPAVMLLVAGRRDRRSWPLGLYLLDVACTIAEPYVRGWPDPMAMVGVAGLLRTDAFQGALLWFFAAEFPRPAESRLLGRAFQAGFVLWLALGVALAAINTPDSTAWTGVWPAAAVLGRGAAGWYFGVQYLAVLPIAVLVRKKLGRLPAADRARVHVLAGAFAATLGGLLLVVLVRGLLGAEYDTHRLATEALIVTAIFGALPAGAAYAALVQRVLPIDIILHAASQYLLSRSLVHTLALLPLASAALLVFKNRERSVAAVFSGFTGALVLTGGVAGLGLLLTRQRLLAAVDRRFGRRAIPVSAPLMEITSRLRDAGSLDELTETVSSTVSSLFSPRHHDLAIADERGDLHWQGPSDLPLQRNGALAQLLAASDEPLPVVFGQGSLLGRLNDRERMWLTDTGAALLVPMRGPGGELLGVISLAERSSELPYGPDDRRVMAAIASTSGMGIYRLRAIERTPEGMAAGADALTDAPARECVECGRLLEPDAIACTCGAPLQRAPVPLVLRDRLRMIRRIGAGAMGVVYEARDLAVRQPRAVKALPETDAALMARLRREARTMAAVAHPGLAAFYALETWHSAPLLVMEYCGGGTLTDRLRRGPLPIDQALTVCAAMAEVLAHLHERGVLHRDVKPSNIGFTEAGAPKLLDFGLAKLMQGAPRLPVGHDSATLTASASLDSEGVVRGTPAYLSPEVLAGAAPAPMDDVWSLSVTLLESCTGTNPFKAATPAATAARVMMDDGRVAAATASLPEPVAALIRGLLDPCRDRRPESAAELKARANHVNQGVAHGQASTQLQ